MVLHTRGRVGSRRFFSRRGEPLRLRRGSPLFFGVREGRSGARLAGKLDRRTLLRGKSGAPCAQEGRLGKIFSRNPYLQ